MGVGEAAAFQSEFYKTLSHLKKSVVLTGHKRHVAAQKIDYVLKQYRPSLPAITLVPALLCMANDLMQMGAYKLARDECFQYVLDLNIIHMNRPVSGGRTYQMNDRTLHHIQALLGRANCRSCLIIQDDPDIQLKESLEEALQALQACSACHALGNLLAGVALFMSSRELPAIRTIYASSKIRCLTLALYSYLFCSA
jgi:hypothetical protein